REKYSQLFPINAVNFCLQEKDITINDIDYIGFYEKPFLKLSRVVTEHLKAYPFSLINFLDAMPAWLEDRLIIPLKIEKELGYKGEILFIKHHLSHAASTFLVSPFQEAAILTADGVGEYASMTLGIGKGNNISVMKELHYPDSLGLVYAIVTAYLGFKLFAGEGKVMSLAAYGKPRYIDKFREIIKINPDGSFKLDSRYFSLNRDSKMHSAKFVKIFGPARKPEEKLEQRHYDMAASLQQLTEEILITIGKHLYYQTGIDKLCLAGGVFLNCVANYKIIQQTPFKEIFIQPAAGDSGCALGAAAYIYNSILRKPRSFIMKHPYLGPDFSNSQIEKTLVSRDLAFKQFDHAELTKYIAKALAQDKIIGWFQGKMEFGPRALGNRSILANPCNPGMKNILNSKVKLREAFRPFAPAILEEYLEDFFQSSYPSPFMQLAVPLKKEKIEAIPSVAHIDGTARLQSVDKNRNPVFWQLIKEFQYLTGIPVILNTSFNLKGEPIVCTPEDAIDCFRRAEMDYLVLENYVLKKEDYSNE
ncbi:carbamoyltransferase, partial [Candidatus Omnitrophota bacterium]